MHLHSSLHIAQSVAVEVKMLTNSSVLVLALQLWAITSTCVRAQSKQLLEPPYNISVVRAERKDRVLFSCTTLNSSLVEEWVLYRNGVRQNTTDPCVTPRKLSDDGVVLTISSACDGIFSCGAKYTNMEAQTGLVFSNALRVYGECLGLCFAIQYYSTRVSR